VAKSIHSKHYHVFIGLLEQVRHERKITQVELAKRLDFPQSRVSKVESGERRMDVIELRDWCEALEVALPKFIQRLEKAIKGG
jgi:transcriptional regulator with XRE-family HTH domain